MSRLSVGLGMLAAFGAGVAAGVFLSLGRSSSTGREAEESPMVASFQGGELRVVDLDRELAALGPLKEASVELNTAAIDAHVAAAAESRMSTAKD